MKRILLITMPFGIHDLPTIGLSLLKAGLTQRGIPCDVRYFNLTFASLIGEPAYQRICELNTVMLGDWLFGEALHGDQIPSMEQYRDELLEPFFNVRNNDIVETSSSPIDERTVMQYLQLRDQVEPFLHDCFESINWDEYSLVGFTCTFQQSVASLALARRVKEKFPKVQIIFGGAACDGEMGHALHRLFPFLDYICSGEGDLNFPILAERILNGQPPGDIPGIIQRGKHGKALLPSIASAPVTDMDAIPFPDYDDFFKQWSALPALQSVPSLAVETSRGCWWGEKSQCTFCGLNGSGIQFRAKSPKRALEEFSRIAREYSNYNLLMTDCIMDLRYFKEVLPHLDAINFRSSMYYETKANLRKEQVRQFREAGAINIQPGIESLSTETLRLMRKGVNLLQVIQLLRWCIEFMIRPSWNILYGFPGESPEEYRRQAELIPLLVHLTPPMYTGTIRLDRFSPLHNDPEGNSLLNVRATKAYSYIHPFAMDDLNQLAYYFEFDYADGRNPLGYVQELRQAVNQWGQASVNYVLNSSIERDVMTIRDTRPIARQASYTFTGAHRTVYEACDEARSRQWLLNHLASLAIDVDASMLDDILGGFISENLMIEESGRFLSLAVDVGYRARLFSGTVNARKISVDAV